MKTYYVNANSQFTYQPAAETNCFDLKNANLDTLIEGEVFTFGHFVFGDNHNAFAVHLRKLQQSRATDIAKDIRHHLDAYDKKPGWGNPDLLLYPTESSAEHFVENYGDCFRAHARAALTPAFREFGRRELRIEPRLAYRADQNFFVVFFDDSISSGNTERNAIDAVLAELNSVCGAKEKCTVHWLTYTIVRRYGTGDQSKHPTSLHYVASDNRKLVAEAASFCELAHESVGRFGCSLCEAVARVQTGLHWVSRFNRSTRVVLRNTCDLMRAHQSEFGGHFCTILPQPIVRLLVALHSYCVYDACFSLQTRIACNPERLVASAFYVALNFHDVRPYLSSAFVINLVIAAMDVEQIVLPRSGDRLSSDALLCLLALLPTSALREIVCSPKGWAKVEGLPQSYGLAILSLLIGNEYQLFQRRSQGESSTNFARDRQLATVKEIGTLMGVDYDAKSAARDGKRNDHSALRPYLVAIAGGQERTPVTLARELAVRLYRGAHESYVYTEIRGMTLATVHEVFVSVTQILRLEHQLMNQLGMPLAREVEPAQQRLEEKLRELIVIPLEEDRKKAVPTFAAECWAAIDNFWRMDNGLESFVATGVELKTEVQQAIERSFRTKAFSDARLSCAMDRLIHLDMPDRMRLTVLLPSSIDLNDLIKNLIENPFHHFDDASRQVVRNQRPEYLRQIAPRLLAQETPLVRIHVRMDPFRHDLVLLFADRARDAKASSLFLHRTSLTNSKLQLEQTGGDLRYDIIERSAETMVLFDDLVNELHATGFHNGFTVRLPIIIDDELYPPIQVSLME